MEPEQARRATAAALTTAEGRGLTATDAVVLSDSNRLVARLRPCDTIARVAVDPTPEYRAMLAREVDVAARLAATGAPVAGLDPRVEAQVVDHDGCTVSLWSAVDPGREHPFPPAEYADALTRLHSGLRAVDVDAPSVTERIELARWDVLDRAITPDLDAVDRSLLDDTLRDRLASVARRGAPEQLLHGEPHPWNVLDTSDGLRFVDYENAARGPVEYDLAWVPAEVAAGYPGVDLDLLDDFRGIVLAIIAMHRWRRGDQHPSGRVSGVAFLDAIRAGSPWRTLDAV